MQEVEEVERWWKTGRFSHVKRPYTAQDVVKFRGTLRPTYLSDDMAKKAWNMFVELRDKRKASITFGALDPVQVYFGYYVTVLRDRCLSCIGCTNG